MPLQSGRRQIATGFVGLATGFSLASCAERANAAQDPGNARAASDAPQPESTIGTPPARDRIFPNILDWNGYRGVPLRGDGHADDSVGINQALASGEVGLCFPRDRRFGIGGPLKVPSNTVIEGGGWRSVITVLPGANTAALRNENDASGISNVEIRRMKIEGNKEEQKAGVRARGIWFVNATDIYIEDVWVDNTECHGVFLSDGGDSAEDPSDILGRCVLVRVKATNCGKTLGESVGGSGILAGGDAELFGCYGGFNMLNGFKTSGPRAKYYGCLAEWSTQGGGFETGFVPGHRTSVEFYGCSARYNFTDGYRHGQATSLIRHVGTIAEYNGSSGIVLFGETSGFVIDGGLLRNNGQAGRRDNRAKPDGLDGISIFALRESPRDVMVTGATKLIDTQTDYVEDGSPTPNRIVCDLPFSWAARKPGPIAIAAGMAMKIRMANTNTGPVTASINRLPPLPVVTQSGDQLGAGMLQHHRIVRLVYSQQQFMLLDSDATFQPEPTQEYGLYQHGASTEIVLDGTTDLRGNGVAALYLDENGGVAVHHGAQGYEASQIDKELRVVKGPAANASLSMFRIGARQLASGIVLDGFGLGRFSGEGGRKSLGFALTSSSRLRLDVLETQATGPWELTFLIQFRKGRLTVTGKALTCGQASQFENELSFVADEALDIAVTADISSVKDTVTQSLFKIHPIV